MEYDYEGEKKYLTTCEKLIMKLVWEWPQDISTVELQQNLRERYGKDYVLATIRTFLVKLSDKGFVRNYRKGKNAYVRPRKTREEYLDFSLRSQLKFWYDDEAKDMIRQVFLASGIKTEAEVEQLKELLADLEGVPEP